MPSFLHYNTTNRICLLFCGFIFPKRLNFRLILMFLLHLYKFRRDFTKKQLVVKTSRRMQ